MVSKIPKTKDNIEKFTFEENDKLDRKIIAENFNKCFENIEGNLVLAVNGDWGQGKSAFLHMWKNQLILNKKEVIYINLWEEDFFKEPFLSIMNAFNDKYSDIKKDLISIGKKIGKYFLEKKTGIDIDNFFENSVYSEIKKDKIKLKKTIADKVSKNEDNFPLIIMIDELDRCNPLYAIDFLEVIKHFFEIDKVVFILGIDIKELEHSIKKVYGDNLNTQRYLKKIIDVIYDLPNPKKEKYIDFLQSKYENLHSEFNTNMIYRNILLDNSNNLRDIEKFFIRYNLTYKKNNIGSNFNLQITDFIKNYLLLMEIFNNDLYNKIKNKNLKKEDFNKIFIFLGEKTLEYRHEQIDESLLLILKYVYPDKTQKVLINDLKKQEIGISQVLLVRRISQYLKIEPIFSEIEFLGGVK